MTDPGPSQYDGERDEERFWAEAVPACEPATQRWFVPTIAIAIACSVPWYWSGQVPQWLGMPAWVWVTVGCSAVVSTVTAVAAVLYWRDTDED